MSEMPSAVRHLPQRRHPADTTATVVYYPPDFYLGDDMFFSGGLTLDITPAAMSASVPVADDVSFIAKRLKEVALENVRLTDKLDSLYDADLDRAAELEGINRQHCEHDASFRIRIKMVMAERNAPK